MSKKKVILFLSVIFAVMFSMTAVFSSAYLTDTDKKDSIILKSAKLKNEITVELLQNHIDNGASTAVMTCSLKNQSNIDITNSIQLEAGFQMSNDGNKYNDKITALYVYPGELSDNAIISDINNGALNAYSRVVSAGKAKITLPDVVIGKDSEKTLSFKLALDTDNLCGYGNILNIDIAAEAKTKNSGGGIGFTENLGTKSLTLYDNINTSDTNNIIVNGVQTIRAVNVSGTYGVISTEAAPLANLYEVLPIREKNKITIADDNTHFSGYGLTIKNGKLYGTPSTAADVSFTDAITFCYSGDTKKIGYAYLHLVIEPYDISNGNIEVSALESFVYTGSDITPSPTVKNKNINKNLVLNEDYTLSYSDNVNVGAGTIKISGKGNYTGQISKTFDISARDIAETTISEIDDYTYTGNVIQPTPTITYNGKTLVKDTDYTLSYSNNTNAGTATVIISGKGNFDGSTSKTFTINKRAISSATVGTISSYTYDGNAKTPTPTITYNGKTLAKDTDYTLSYSNNTNAGTATVTISGKGNFDGSTSKNFTINKANASVSTAPQANSLTYNGNAQTLITSGTANGGTMHYKLGSSGTYSTTRPTATDADTYTVYYYVKGDSNHYDTSASSLSVTISKASQPAPTTLTANVDSLTQVTLSASGSGKTALEYSKDGTNWQSSNVFGGLTSNSTYTFRARYSGTSNYYVSSSKTVSATLSYFTWSGTTITGLTSLGQKQIALEVPSKTTAINSTAFSKCNSNLKVIYVDREINAISGSPWGAKLSSGETNQYCFVQWRDIFKWNSSYITGFDYSYYQNYISKMSSSQENSYSKYSAIYFPTTCTKITGTDMRPYYEVNNWIFACGDIPNGICNTSHYAFRPTDVYIMSTVQTIGATPFYKNGINIYIDKPTNSIAPSDGTWIYGNKSVNLHWSDEEEIFALSADSISLFSEDDDVKLLQSSNALPLAEAPEIPTPSTTFTPEPTLTPVPSASPTPSILPTLEPVATPAESSTPTPSILPTLEPTATPVPSSTPTPSISPTFEPTATPAESSTPTSSISPTLEPTLTPAPSSTPISTAIIKEMDKGKKTQVWALSISVKNTVLDRILKEV